MSANILAQLNALPRLDQKDFLAEYVKGEFKNALYMAESDDIATNVSIFDLGLNSLGAETLKQRFEQQLQCNIDTTDFFANPTIDYFIINLCERLFDEEKAFEKQADGSQMHDMVNEMLSTLYGTGNSPKG